jgi:phytoene dehydrogenase-like protein
VRRRVAAVLVRRGRAVGMRLADGTHVDAPAGVIAGTGAPQRSRRLPPGRTATCRSARGDAGGELAGRWDEPELDRFVARMEDEIERLAPGFRDHILARHIAGPRELERTNANLVGGAINGGTAKLHQQLIFRPVPGLGRSETPVRGLYLGSASAHPGGGVHGAPRANAARALLARRRLSPTRLLRWEP